MLREIGLALFLASVGIKAGGNFINTVTLMGMIAGSYTDPPALAYANQTAGNDAPALGYTTVYPLAMFLRIITAQLLIMFLG